MNPTRLLLSEAVRHLLRTEADAEAGTSPRGAAAAARVHEKLSRSLSPVLGEAGFEALFARSIKLTKPGFASLRELETTGPAQSVTSLFFERLDKEEPAVAAAIAAALMVTFVGMVSAFIGEGLTWQLLCNAWPDLPSPGPGEKST